MLYLRPSGNGVILSSRDGGSRVPAAAQLASPSGIGNRGATVPAWRAAAAGGAST